MLILIDKSGCPGFKLAKNSTPYLVIGIVLFKDFTEAEKASAAVCDLKIELNIKPEFKFSKSSFKIKEKFIDKICQYDFQVRVLIADKVGINVPNLRSNSKAFYEYLITTLLKNNEDILSDATIKINKNTARNFREILHKHLSADAEQYKIKKFKFCESKSDALIQLVDMVTSTVAKSYTDDSVAAHQLFNKLITTNKIKNTWKLRESS